MRHKRVFLMVAAIVLATLVLQGQTPPALHDGTPLKLRLNRSLSSADATVGETVDFEVLEDVKVNNIVVIARGGTALGTVTEAQPKRRLGRGGKLNMKIDYVRLVDGENVTLRSVKESQIAGKGKNVTGAVVATSIVFFPAAPFLLLMRGKDVTVPKGTEITAYVNGEIPLNPAKFGPAAQQEAAAPLNAAGQQQSNVTRLSNEDIISMVKAGLAEDTVVAAVRRSAGSYRLRCERLRPWPELRRRTSGELAGILKAPRSSVSQWLSLYQRHGVEGLLEGYRSGRPPLLTAEQRTQLGDILDSGPVAYGLDTGLWTSPMLAWVIEEEFGVAYHPGMCGSCSTTWASPCNGPVACWRAPMPARRIVGTDAPIRTLKKSPN